MKKNINWNVLYSLLSLISVAFWISIIFFNKLYYDYNWSLRTLVTMHCFCLFTPFVLFYIFPICVCTPLNSIPNNLEISDNVLVKCVDEVTFLVLVDKPFYVNMRGWVFKKRYIRDLILMYFHINNNKNRKKRLIYFFSKKNKFKNNYYVKFVSQTKPAKTLYLIKNGRECGSFLYGVKLFCLTAILILCNQFNREAFYRNISIQSYYDISNRK